MERENQSSTEIKTTMSGDAIIPTFSFAGPAQTSDDAVRTLTKKHFEIPIINDKSEIRNLSRQSEATTDQKSTIVFDAYYDPSHKLIFVLDETRDPQIPNALLVINQDPTDLARKWDDILSRDYGVDLETVRPKKNNKYQKLDIEYNGLSVYNRIITAHAAGENLDISELDEFRRRAAHRIATARLDAAKEERSTAQETVAATEKTIATLVIQIKHLREKLKTQKAKIGKEPTKESAAKILRGQAKIESANEKLKRAESRLRRAKKRIKDAEFDAAAAKNAIAAARLRPIESDGQADTIEKEIVFETPKPKVQDMPEEVKPLFNKDPEIMDESIAFKPIEFNPSPQSGAAASAPITGSGVPAFESFSPPPFAEVAGGKPSVMPEYAPDLPPPATYATEPVHPAAPMPSPAYAPPPPLPPSPAPAAPVSRPMPMGGTGEVHVVGPQRRRPSGIYYVMLAILIALSVLTLWLYQNRMETGTPNIVDNSAGLQNQIIDENPNSYATGGGSSADAGNSPFLDFGFAPSAPQPVETVAEPEPAPIQVPAEETALPPHNNSVPAAPVAQSEPELPSAPANDFYHAAPDAPGFVEEEEEITLPLRNTPEYEELAPYPSAEPMMPPPAEIDFEEDYYIREPAAAASHFKTGEHPEYMQEYIVD